MAEVTPQQLGLNGGEKVRVCRPMPDGSVADLGPYTVMHAPYRSMGDGEWVIRLEAPWGAGIYLLSQVYLVDQQELPLDLA